MKLINVHSGTREALENKEYNIGIGISLGNKYFSPEKILESIKWALPYTKDHLIVYVADSIHAINIEVRSDKSPESALRRVLRQGDEIIQKVKDLVEKELPDNQVPIIYAHWSDVETEEYSKKKDYLYGLYRQKSDFYKAVTGIVKEFTKDENQEFSDRDIERLGTYIVEELPEVLSRVPIAGHECDAFIYPEKGALSEFVVKIQNGEIFPEVRENVMDTEPKVFLEVR